MLGNLGGFSPEKLTQHFSNMDLPADKEQLIRQAEEKHMDDRIVGILRKIPPGVYNSVNEILGGAEKQELQQAGKQHGKGGGGGISDAIKDFTKKH